MSLPELKKDLSSHADPEKVKILARFFKTGKGEYGEGDKFIGVKVPAQRTVALKYKTIPLKDVEKLLKSQVHEHRLTALLILTYRFPKLTEREQKEVIDLYLKNTKYINNWDLVDISAPKLLGTYLLDKHDQRKILHKLAKSKSLWERRIAMLATYAFIKEKDFNDALKIAETLLHDKHDLMHKAVGWMLREIGNRNQETEEKFLKSHCRSMPRTTLRYAIEKFSEEKRKFYMAK
jgi:3-methyladenine DNA glycosylase AlkD